MFLCNVADKTGEASLQSLGDVLKALEADNGILELLIKHHEEQGVGSEILTAIFEKVEKIQHLVMDSPNTFPERHSEAVDLIA